MYACVKRSEQLLDFYILTAAFNRMDFYNFILASQIHSCCML